jgi:hypothetical protein
MTNSFQDVTGNKTVVLALCYQICHVNDSTKVLWASGNLLNFFSTFRQHAYSR